MPEVARNRRADARRSRAAILDAAVRLLNTNPDAGVEAIAAAAGVTRQTVYAHFPSREKLLAAVVDHVTEEAVEAMDATDLDAGPPPTPCCACSKPGSGPPGATPCCCARSRPDR